MNSLSVSTVTEKNRLGSGTPFVVLLEAELRNSAGGIESTMRFANNTEAVNFEGNVFAPVQFDFEIRARSGEQAEVSLTVVDYTRVIIAELEARDGLIGSGVRFIVVNTDNLAQGAEVEEFFEVVDTSVDTYAVTWRLGTQNFLAQQFPRRVQYRTRCAWRYKGTECGYAGTIPTCDLSLDGGNGCRAHANTPNYGGFPGIQTSGTGYV